MDNTGVTPIRFIYRFWLSNNVQQEFVVELDPDTLLMVADHRESYPAWVRLDYETCPNCTLDRTANKYCPVAANLTDLVEYFRDIKSHEIADVCVISDERKYVKQTPVQYVISSLIGIIMPTSGCPILSKLRPLVKSHLPFPSTVESVYRVISLYLLEQYLDARKGGRPDWELKGLLSYFDEVELVNAAFCRRLNAMRHETGDACLNAVNNLNNLGVLTRLAVEEDDLVDDRAFDGGSWSGRDVNK